MRRRELFPTDPGLTARMVLAAVGTPVLVAGALAALVLVAPLKVVGAVALASVIGAVLREGAGEASGREATPAQWPALHAAVERLCLLADLPKPRIVIEPEALPNSWIVGVARGTSRLHLTEGLLARLEPAELEAVIAHELAHVAHRDASVMTIVGGPGAALLGGGLKMLRAGGFALIGGLVAAGIGWLATLGTRALSRYREYAADAGAAVLTGHPAALASALMKVSDGLVAIPAQDLRVAAARDAFHLLPTGERERLGRLPLSSTHPSLRARIARLERLEASLQAARPARVR